MNKLLYILLLAAAVLTSVRLSDFHFQNNHLSLDWISGQTLAPDASMPKTEPNDTHQDKKSKSYEFREENPEVTSDDEETLIEED